MSDSGLYIGAHFNGEQVECREAVGSVLRPKEESRACIRWQRQLPVGCSDSQADCSTSRLGIPHAVQTDPLQDTHTFSWGSKMTNREQSSFAHQELWHRICSLASRIL